MSTNRVFLCVCVCVCVVLSPLAVFAATPEEDFDALFGKEAKQAAASPNPKDHAAFAAKLLAGAKLVEEQKALQALLYEKAYDFGIKDPDGYPTALDAMNQLSVLDPNKAPQCQAKLLNVRQLRFNKSTGDQKKEAGEELVTFLMTLAAQSEQAGKFDESVVTLRRALETAAFIKSDRKAEISDKLKNIIAGQQTRKDFEALAARLKENPKNVAARKALFIARLGEFYDLEEAKKLLTDDLDAKFLASARLALEKQETLKEEQLTELAEWYNDLAEKATSTTQWMLYDNARSCCARYLELHAAKDTARLKVTMLQDRVEKGLAKATPPPAKAAAIAEKPPEKLAPVTGKGCYFVIPIKGEIGMEVSSSRVKALLDQAAQVQAPVVVFEMDTGGGAIQDAEQIVDQMILHKGLRYVAVVHRALSAGATITFACQEIYVTETATFGAAVSYSSSAGMPTALAEKFQSVWRAVCRKAADFGQHPSVLAEAMVDPDFNVTLRMKDGNPIVERNGQGEIFKPRGRILCLTAKECISCGLAVGICPDVASLGSLLKLDNWTRINEPATAAGGAIKKLAGEITPVEIREPLLHKYAELRLNDYSLTEIQREAALQEWKKWLTAQAYETHTIHGRVTLMDVMSESSAKDVVEEIKQQLEVVNTALTESENGKRKPPLTKTQIDELRTAKKRLTEDVRDLEECPYLVTFASADDPLVRISANLTKSAKGLIVTAARGTEFDLVGRLRDVRVTPSRSGKTHYVNLYLTRGTISSVPKIATPPRDNSVATPTKPQDKTPEKVSVKPLDKPATLSEKEETWTLNGGVPLKLVLIPAGKFTMGSPSTEIGHNAGREGPQHEVAISKPFYMGIYTITQGQWKSVMGTEPWKEKGRAKDDDRIVENADCPAIFVRWDEAVEFCKRLSQQSRMSVRLPTEAEWEYVCRAGSTTRYYYGEDHGYHQLSEYAWNSRNAADTNEKYAHPVGQKKPNAWGLYDMHGNVWQLCLDWFNEKYYANSKNTDPQGPDSGTQHVMRGGSWKSSPHICRTAVRYGADRTMCAGDIGFRIVVQADAKTVKEKTPAPIATPAVPEKEKVVPLTGKEAILTLAGGVKMKLVLIPAGKFMMGSPESEKDRSKAEGPQHEVEITKPFYMGVTPVTAVQYESVMGKNPSKFKGAQNPVDSVSWDDAMAFCKLLSDKSGKKVRLPTEAEWEYACRAGTTTRFNFGEDDTNFSDYGWYKINSESKTHPVGQKKPNAWGLYDMHGNVWNWCLDWYDEGYYSTENKRDPQGPATGSLRVMRGGSWGDESQICRTAHRYKHVPDRRTVNYGFRVVVQTDGK